MGTDECLSYKTKGLRPPGLSATMSTNCLGEFHCDFSPSTLSSQTRLKRLHNPHVHTTPPHPETGDATPLGAHCLRGHRRRLGPSGRGVKGGTGVGPEADLSELWHFHPALLARGELSECTMALPSVVCSTSLRTARGVWCFHNEDKTQWPLETMEAG